MSDYHNFYVQNAYEFWYNETEDCLYLYSEDREDYKSNTTTNSHDFWSLDDWIFSDPFFYELSKDDSD